jgi:NAD(P)-dependent dehydrogenase (short-subunit alcohol dehydrogenase family)
MTMRLRNKVAVITGSGGAIGSVTAKKYAKEGAKVLVTDINVEGGQQTVKEIKRKGGEALFIKADIAKVSECEKIINSAFNSFGRIDVLFNNAGIELVKMMHEYTEEDYDRVVDINLKGSFFCTRYALPEMMKQGGGCIINMGSIAAFMGFEKIPSYCAAKGALVNLTRYIALEYARYNIRCNCICPGAVATDMMNRFMTQHPDLAQKGIDNHPMGRLATPEEIADAAVFLASDEATFITGISLPVDGGYLSGKI